MRQSKGESLLIIRLEFISFEDLSGYKEFPPYTLKELHYGSMCGLYYLCMYINKAWPTLTWKSLLSLCKSLSQESL